MITISNVEVMGREAAIRGMRNPMNSWDKSDSRWDYSCGDDYYAVGEKDLALMQKLADAGPVHGKFMRMITVYMDITAPLYWWSEYDTYKVGTVANSCSKMHKLLHKPFEMSDFSFDQLPGYKREVKHFRPLIDESIERWAYIDREYVVSNQGRVRHKQRILSGSVHKDHYIFVTMHGKQYPIHRLVAERFVENKEGKPEVNHIDGNKMNNCADNLEWVTRSENQKHAVETNLQPKATTTYKGKFTAEERAEIKRLYDCGMHSRRRLAEMFGVSHTCINDILNDKYKYAETVNAFEEAARPIVDTLNEMRDLYLACDDEVQKKEIWYSILQLLPESYNQKRTVMLNYEVLRNMYKSRKNHKLDEWRELCKKIEELPYSELICGKDS